MNRKSRISGVAGFISRCYPKRQDILNTMTTTQTEVCYSKRGFVRKTGKDYEGESLIGRDINYIIVSHRRKKKQNRLRYPPWFIKSVL
ncbi:MAG: hypothetical protein PHI66_03125 [Candidatus Pacebacteria bacterium]|nr:hypothetical protein [Candidatus Paceibacterota bacterium]